VWAGTVGNEDNVAEVKPYFFSVNLPYNTTLTASPSSDQAIEALEHFLNITPPRGYTIAYTVTGNVLVPAKGSVQISAYMPIDDENGTCDIYGTNGYQGIGTFDVHLPEANPKTIPPSL
jgi:hypothetical protein